MHAPPPPHLDRLTCLPVHAVRCAHVVSVPVGKQVRLSGVRLYRGMRVTFRWSSGALATTLSRTRAGWIARVPAGTKAGTVSVTVRDRHLRRSNVKRMRVLAPPPPPQPVTTPAPTGALPAAFTGNGMWIWQLPKSEGGDPAAIGARARAAGMQTVFVKAGDGTSAWSQFSSTLVADLHAQGLRACAWQFVYGASPVAEAQIGAGAVAAGADCLVIDAESDYEGRYAAAQRYITALRGAIGEDFPVALTSFPYVDYHPNLPYSVFLAPGAAQVNSPQVYWKAIGGGVDAVSAHTWRENRIYQAPIAAIGQAYDAPSSTDLARFRAIWSAWGAGGISWWSWQSASDATWTALSQPAPAPSAPADPGWPLLKLNAKGDEVIWLQQHLASADATVPIDGVFGSQTDAALRSFQQRELLPVTGETDPATWQAVLALPLRSVDWTTGPPASTRSARAARAPELPQLGRG